MKTRWSLASGVLIVLMPVLSLGDLFLFVPGAPGESMDANHMDWIEVSSFGHGVNWDGSQASHQNLTVTYTMDKSVPVVNIRACDHQSLTNVVLELTHSGDTSELVYRVKLWDAHVTGVSVSGTGATTGQTVSVTFDFGRIEWKYIPYDQGGAPLSAFTAGWNVTNNVSLY